MSKEQRIKSALYRSNYRGCKETDILIGKFANQFLNSFNDDQLNLFEKLIIEDDSEIYDWILNKTPHPKKYQKLINHIRDFHKL